MYKSEIYQKSKKRMKNLTLVKEKYIQKNIRKDEMRESERIELFESCILYIINID